MVRKYSEMGMPKGPNGYDLDVCLRWVDDNISKSGHGGKHDRGKGAASPSLKQLQTQRLEAKLKREQLELERAEGKALDRSATLSTVRAHLTVVRQRVEKIGPDAAKAVAAAFGIPSERMNDLRAVLAGEIAKALSDIQGQPLPVSEG